MAKTALILAGHGSHISPATAGVVWGHVDTLRAMGVADEVTAAFWKEPPSFHGVFKTLEATDIAVVPMFTAQGYFTQTVIPAEMGLNGAITRRNGLTIRYARTLSEHPYLAGVVRQRVETALHELGTAPDQVAVAIIGHSTRRNPESRRATEQQAALVRQSRLAAEVVAVYLDDSPSIGEIYTLTTAPNLIAVPFFLAAGSHTTLDVPRALGLAPGQTGGEVQGQRLLYTRPVGVDDSLVQVILELAREAGAPLYEPKAGSPWDCFPKVGKHQLIRLYARKACFGQVRLMSSIRREGDSRGLEEIADPGTLRERVRNGNNRFRPLPTARDLPGGWRVLVSSAKRMHAVVETIYPGAPADWELARRNAFAPGSFETAIARQTGMFRSLEGLTRDNRAEVVEQVCQNCVRTPTWHSDELGQIPCAEPCNFWLSRALEQIKGEQVE